MPEETMKAIFIDQFGGPEKLKMGQFSKPIPESNEIQIKIAYAAVNPVDWKIRLGLFQQRMPSEFPLIPGWDAAGIVSALGANVKNFKIGDAIFGYCRKPTIKWGTYAAYICYEAENISAKPQNLSFAQAAAIPLAGLTAWQALFDSAQLKKGDSLLIHAGAGGVGSLAIQFAKQAGAHILTTASESNHAYVKNLGADVVIDYKKQNVLQEVKKIYPKGLNIVFDTIGGQTFKDSFQLLQPNGKIVSLIEHPNSLLEEQFKVKSLYIFVSPNGKQLKNIATLIEEGKVQPIQVQEMPLEKAADAQIQSQEGHTQGKIVLKIQ